MGTIPDRPFPNFLDSTEGCAKNTSYYYLSEYKISGKDSIDAIRKLHHSLQLLNRKFVPRPALV